MAKKIVDESTFRQRLRNYFWRRFPGWSQTQVAEHYLMGGPNRGKMLSRMLADVDKGGRTPLEKMIEDFGYEKKELDLYGYKKVRAEKTGLDY